MSSEAVSYFVGSLSSASEGPAVEVETVGGVRMEHVRQLTASPPTSSEISDTHLLLSLSQGDREALSILFRRYARRVRNVAYRILKDEQEAEDLVQEVFLFIFRKADQFNPELGTAASWIIHIAYHRSFDRRRHLVSRHFYDGHELDDSTIRSAMARPPNLPSSGTMQEILGKDLMRRYEQRLSSDQRRVIDLYFFGGHTFDEVAEAMGVSVMNVRSHYYRGLERLRRYVLPENFRTQ